MNFEKPPAGGGARGYIRNSPELARLRFYCRPRNRGKGGEAVKVYTITYFKINLSGTKMNFENPPAGGGAHG